MASLQVGVDGRIFIDGLDKGLDRIGVAIEIFEIRLIRAISVQSDLRIEKREVILRFGRRIRVGDAAMIERIVLWVRGIIVILGDLLAFENITQNAVEISEARAGLGAIENVA